MERLTACAQGYCEMYCKEYGHCFGEPGDCIFKDEIKLYEAVKSIEGIVPFDRILELACADKAGRLVVLPCKVGSLIYVGRKPAIITRFFCYVREQYFHAVFCDENKGIDIPLEDLGKTVFLTSEEAEAALKGGEG